MRVASSMRRDRFLLPDGVTVASLLLGLRDPPAPQDAMDAPPPPPSEADVLRARRVLDVFSSLVFDPTFAPAMGQPADDPPLFSDQAAPPAPADAGRDMPIDLSDFPFAAHLLLRSAAVATRSGAAVAECHRRIVSLDLVPGEDPRRLSGTLVSALVMAGSPARAGGHLRRAWEGGEAPEAGRVATVWLALDGAGRREEAGRWLEFARGMGGEVGGEVEVLEAYFKKREAGEGVAG
ncbi:hypothetical protein DFJ74DRAFT_654289 [Hyaloraphidium curvatum]|nr:hypothetical protein DFJ74DRAFT_654289 [Hyaloraphidium curvatum]